MPDTDRLDQLLRESGFLWRARSESSRPWSRAPGMSPVWRRIDSDTLAEFLGSHNFRAVELGKEVASIVCRHGGRVEGEGGVVVYEVPLSFFLGDFGGSAGRMTYRSRAAARWARRPRGIRLSLPPELRGIGWIDLGLLVALAALFVVLVTGPFSSPSYCEKNSVWCGAAGSIVAAIGLGLAGLLLFFMHAHRAIKHYLFEARDPSPGLASGRLDRRVLPRDGFDADGLRIEKTDLMGALGVIPWSQRFARLLWGLSAHSTESAAPVRLIVGRPGAGKSTLLQSLGRQLALAGFVPVAVNATELNENGLLISLARQKLREWLDAAGVSGREATRTVEWISQSGKLVILADDLHRLVDLDHQTLTRLVLNASRQGCAVIATARRGDVPVELEQWVVDIEELQPMSIGESSRMALALAAARWQKMVEEGLAPPPPSSPARALENLIACGELHRNRFFIAHILPRLICAGPRPGLADLITASGLASGDLRARLLDLYLEAFVSGKLRPYYRPGNPTPEEIKVDERLSEERHSLVEILEEVCLATVMEQKEVTIDRATVGVEQAIATGILRPLNGELVTVEHGILQSYFASRGLLAVNGDHAMVQMAGSVEVDDALCLFAGRQDRQQQAKGSCERLLAEDYPAPVGRRPMGVAITAADIAHAARIDASGPLTAIQDRWESAGPSDRCNAVESVAKLGTPEAIWFLWDKCQDPDYRVRWAVAQGISENPFSAGLLHATLGKGINDVFDDAAQLAAERRDVDDWEPEVLRLKTLAWMLPALELGTRDPAERELLAGDINHLLFLLNGQEQPGYPRAAGFDGITQQLGLEASIAQGFRVAARLAARRAMPYHRLDASWTETLKGVRERLEQLQTATTFWYSKLLLLHGLAELAIVEQACEKPHGGGSAIVRFGQSATREHPFLKRAARLCDQAVRKAERLAHEARRRKPQLEENKRAVMLEQLWEISDEYIWDDEGIAVRTISTRLRPAALLLLADVTVLLNLIEKGSVNQRRHLPRRDDLPVCLSAGPHGQWRMLGEDSRARPLGCSGPPRCQFNLCPYRDPIARAPNAMRPFSRAFCLQLRQSITSTTRLRVRSADLHGRFWAEMADRFSR